MGVATFVLADWRARYPEFAATVSDLAAADCFYLAMLYCDNSPNGRVPCNPPSNDPRTPLLYMLTAHIAQLQYGSAQTGGQPSPLVGRVSDASQGSVSVSADMGETQPAAAWYYQTKYGAAYWAATSRFRRAKYIPGPRPFPGARGGI